jgi:MFS family permease
MLKERFRWNVKAPKGFFLVIFLLINSLTWYFLERRNIFEILEPFKISTEQNLIVWGVWDLAIIGSGIAGAIFSGKIRRFTFLYLWMILGIIASLLICFLPFLPLSSVFLVSFLSAMSFGLGMSTCLAYFADETNFENRGSTGGLIFFMASGATPLIFMISGASFVLSSLASLAWRVLGLVILHLLRPAQVKIPSEERRQTTFKLILFDKQVLLYLIPWFMFSFIYGFQKVTLEQSLQPEFYDSLLMIQPVSATISAILSGLICDRVGRKRVVIYGFVSLGIAYAIVGITGKDSAIPFYVYSVIDGIAWGIFITIFVLTLWGDFSYLGMKYAEKYYAVGSIPFFFADFIGLLFSVYVRVPVSAAFSVASFFLFLAVLPLVYAPETLPEKKIKERELKDYIEKAEKIKKKFT